MQLTSDSGVTAQGLTVDAVEQMEADEERVIAPAELFRKWEQGQWRLTELPMSPLRVWRSLNDS